MYPTRKLQRFDVRSACRAVGVDDEVRMLFRHARAAAGAAFQSAGLDQARGVAAGRIAEHASGVGQAEGLGGHAPCEELLDAGAGALAIAALEPEVGGDEPFLAGAAAMAVADLELALRPLAQHAAPVDRHRALDDVPGFGAIAARVHGERAADGARDPGEKLRAGQVLARREARHLGARHTGIRINEA
jgi:hypothetical protein